MSRQKSADGIVDLLDESKARTRSTDRSLNFDGEGDAGQ
jgi:hypothetical protein